MYSIHHVVRLWPSEIGRSEILFPRLLPPELKPAQTAKIPLHSKNRPASSWNPHAAKSWCRGVGGDEVDSRLWMAAAVRLSSGSFSLSPDSKASKNRLRDDPSFPDSSRRFSGRGMRPREHLQRLTRNLTPNVFPRVREDRIPSDHREAFQGR
jgi:hypothetical protein